MKKVLIFILIIILVTGGIIFFHKWNKERKTILNCTRENGDKLYLKFNDFGITEMKINGIDLSVEELAEYQSNFEDEFSYNLYSHLDKSDTYIQKQIMTVANYEKKEYHSECSYYVN